MHPWFIFLISYVFFASQRRTLMYIYIIALSCKLINGEKEIQYFVLSSSNSFYSYTERTNGRTETSSLFFPSKQISWLKWKSLWKKMKKLWTDLQHFFSMYIPYQFSYELKENHPQKPKNPQIHTHTNTNIDRRTKQKFVTFETSKGLVWLLNKWKFYSIHFKRKISIFSKSGDHLQRKRNHI